MKTIFGKLCKFFYQDTYEPESHKWTWSHLGTAPFVRLVADEAKFPTHCGDSLSRIYTLRYLLEESGRGKLIQKLTDGNQTYGFRADYGILEGWLDKADGFFKLNVPDEAANYEICHQMYYNFALDRCFGIRADCKTDFITYKILPDYGILIYNYVADNGSWVWCPINPQTGMFYKSNTIRPSTRIPPSYPYTEWRYPTPEVIWLNNQFFTCVVVDSGVRSHGHIIYNAYIETWTPQPDGSLAHSSETRSTQFVYNDEDEIIGSYLEQSPPMSFCGHTWRFVGTNGYPNNNAVFRCGQYVYTFSSGLWTPFIPLEVQASMYGFVGMPDYITQYPSTYIWKYTAEQLGVHQIQSAGHNRDWAIVGLYTYDDPASEEAIVTDIEYALIRKSDGAIINRVPGSPGGYTHKTPVSNVGFANGIPYYFYFDETDHRSKIMDLRNGTQPGGYAYRDYFRFGSFPASWVGADKTLSWPGYNGWSSAGHSLPTTYISAGNVFHLSLTNNSIIIYQSTITDLSTSCPTDHYKASCSYKIVRKGNHAPVKDAQVSIKVVAEEINGSVQFEYTWTAITDLQGMVYAEMPNCVMGANYFDFRICFEALDVIPPSVDENGTAVEWFYASAQNEAEEKLCVTHPATSLCCGMTPPKGTMTSVSAPYNYGGVWYSIMSCQAWSNPAAGRKPNGTCGCTQYRFVCQEDDTKSTGWRDIYNLAGQNDPTGAQAVPTTYWWVNPSRLRYHWAVQYRPCQCEQIGERSDWMAG